MMNDPESSHSSNVAMWLEIHGTIQRIELRRIGPTYVILDDPVDVPPCQADLVVSVDGKISRCRVDMPSGISKNSVEASAFTVDHFAPF